MYKNKILLLVFSSLFHIQLAIGQNNTNSPYTRFGYGEISETNSGEQRAMGGVSLGSRSHININVVNPASYSIVDSMTFMFDIGSSTLLSRFSDVNGSSRKINSNLEYITMQFPLSKNLGFSAGLLPYSFLGYSISTSGYNSMKNNSLIPDTIYYNKNFTGSGGFSQVYMGISANIFEHVSLGINTYYMYGDVNNYRNLNLGSSTGYNSTTQLNNITAKNFRFRFGAQIYNTFEQKHLVTLGLIYEQKAKLGGGFKQINVGIPTDTIVSNSDFELPTIYGIGFNYSYDKKLLLGLDYTLQAWKDAKFFGKTDSLTNRSKIAAGIEYQPNSRSRKYFNRIRYRAGVNLSNSYYKIDGNTPSSNYGVSLGIGLPMFNKISSTVSMLNASVEYVKLGGVSALNEDYFKFTLNITFNEHWFFKRKL